MLHTPETQEAETAHCPWQPSAQEIASDKEEIILGEIGNLVC